MGIATSVVMTLKFTEKVDNRLTTISEVDSDRRNPSRNMDGYDTRTLRLSQLGKADHRYC